MNIIEQAWAKIKAFKKSLALQAKSQEEAFEIGYEAGMLYGIGANPNINQEREDGFKNQH